MASPNPIPLTLEAMVRACIALDSGPEGSPLFDIHYAEFADGYRETARAILTLIEQSGYKIVPVEATDYQREAMTIITECMFEAVGKIDVGLIYGTGVQAASPSIEEREGE